MEREWSRVNRAKWDELAVLHLAATAYELTALRTGQRRLHPIEEAKLGPVQGLRILPSKPAIAAARKIVGTGQTADGSNSRWQYRLLIQFYILLCTCILP